MYINEVKQDKITFPNGVIAVRKKRFFESFWITKMHENKQ